MTVQHFKNDKIPDDRENSVPAYPLDMWYVVALSIELSSAPIARTVLDHPIVIYRTPDERVHVLEDRCCHRDLPLSSGVIEEQGIRCGYHGLLYDGSGKCIEVPGQKKVPSKARVSSYHVKEQDALVWVWFGAEEHSEPLSQPPRYEVHNNEAYVYGGDVYHYDAPYQLIHDNLLDLSHLGYVHLHTIGGDAKIHMNAEMNVTSEGETVRVTRYMRNSNPPPTYLAAYPFKDKVDRWQEIEFCPSHLKIWTGAVDVNTDAVDDPNRGGFHMRGLHCVTPESPTSSHYFWTIATNPIDNVEDIKAKVIEQTALTFDEDKVVIEAQYANMKRFEGKPMIDIHVDVAANKARRIIESMKSS